MSTTLTLWGQSAVTLDSERGRLTIDPGTLSDLACLSGASAVLITHAHVDHLDVDAVVRAVCTNPALRVIAPADAVARLKEAGATAERLETVAPGDRLTVVGHDVLAVGGEHMPIHEGIPTPANVGYLIDGRLLQPGDAFPELPESTQLDVLLLPVSAPWLRLAVAADYALAVGAKRVIPIHDALLSDAGKSIHDNVVGNGVSVPGYERVAAGTPVAL